MENWAKLSNRLGAIHMRRKRKNFNIATIAALAVLAVAALISVPFVGDWILEQFIYPSRLECFYELKLEAGQPLPQAADFFVANGQNAAFLTDMDAVNTAVPGAYPIELRVGGKTFTSQLVITDTVAPTAQGRNLTVSAPGAIQAKDFVTDIQDATEVTATFVTQPDWSKTGVQQISIMLTDAGGNTTTVNATMTLVIDKTAPTILGAKNLEVYVGDTVSYKSGITVTDDVDTNPQLTVDNSQVDLSKAGVYTVTYTATDAAGNTTVVAVKLTVREKPDDYVDPEVIYAKVDAILAQFIREDMTDREKVEAVYVWTRRGVHLNYGSAPHRDDWLQTAYEFLNVKKGDCFYFYAIQKLMLQRLGIPTIDVKKVQNFEGDSNHYWLLVSVDQGKTYYHFDNVWSRELCLVTDAQLNAFSDVIESHPFNRDVSLYPQTPAQNLPASTLPWEDPAILAAKP